jgi:putative PIG3 family NAD(P)H quinone oxidoreductase
VRATQRCVLSALLDRPVVRAVVLRSHGGPEVLTIEDVPEPAPGPEEVLVDVAATAINRADLLQRMGLYGDPFARPGDLDIPGLEYSGVVAAVGDRCRHRRPGDHVMGIVSGRSYAERLVVHERQTLSVPVGIDVVDAAAIPEVFLTAWDALVVQGALTAGRRALVHAGASGVGTAAIQIAKSIGAQVAVTASAGKLAACRELGADLAVERSPSDWLAGVNAWAPSGVDVVLDVVGELDHNVRAVRVGGRIVQVGVMGGGAVQFSLGALMPKRASLIGTVLRARPIEEKIALTMRFAAEVLPLFEQGVLAPVIDSYVPLDRIADGHAKLDANSTVGKVVVTVA